MNDISHFFGAIQSGEKDRIETLLKLHPELVNGKDPRGFTSLIFAAYFDKKEIVQTLLEYNASIDDTDSSGNTALIGVAFKGNTDLAKLLIQHGAAVNAQNNLGYTPLIFAAMYGQTKMVQLLLDHEADISIKDNEDKLAIDYAKEKQFKAIVELLS